MSNIEQRLKDAEEALRYYASMPVNMLKLYKEDSEPNDMPDEHGDTCAMLGKRARAYFRKYVAESA